MNKPHERMPIFFDTGIRTCEIRSDGLTKNFIIRDFIGSTLGSPSLRSVITHHVLSSFCQKVFGNEKFKTRSSMREGSASDWIVLLLGLFYFYRGRRSLRDGTVCSILRRRNKFLFLFLLLFLLLFLFLFLIEQSLRVRLWASFLEGFQEGFVQAFQIFSHCVIGFGFQQTFGDFFPTIFTTSHHIGAFGFIVSDCLWHPNDPRLPIRFNHP